MLIPLRHAGMNPLVLLGPDMLLGQDMGGSLAPTGRFVGSSGFMAIQGELYDDSYYGPTRPSDDTPHEEFPTWTDLADPVPSALQGFWFHAGIRDSRTRVTGWSPFRLALLDPGTGAAVSLDGDRIVLRGARTLLDDFTALHEEWVGLGSPTMADYTVRLFPAGHATTDENAVPGPHWSMPGRYHTRVLSLEPSRPG